jgi:sugar (pentulose or hexulose) kinase
LALSQVGHLVGLDLGTTTVTALLLDVGRGVVRRLAQRRNDAGLQPVLPTRAEQDPQRLRVLALEALAELAAGDQPVDGIALTSQGHGLLCVDAGGWPLTPLISWQDRRTAEALPDGSTALDELHARTADLPWQENGCLIAHGYGAATLFWLMRHGQLPPATHRVCTIADWLAGQLTGDSPSTDPTLAASWGVYSLVDKAWNGAFLGRLELEPQLFPTVRPSGESLAGLAPSIARRVGLRGGIPVFNALGDTQASFLGCFPSQAEGAGERQPAAQRILLNLGTGGQICWYVPEFELPTEAVETRPLPHGRYLRVGASLCGGAAYAWLNRTVRAWLAEFGVEIDEEAIYERLNALAAAATDIGDLSVRTTFLGVRGDPTIQAGAIEGITLEALRLGALARATLIGMVDELYDLYRAHAGEATQDGRLAAAGGGVRKNPLLPGLIEERFGLPVHVSPQRETAAMGAALSAVHSTARGDCCLP